MLFSTPTFFIFLAFYFLFQCVVPLSYRNFLVIAGSTIFYAWWKLEYAWVPYFLMVIAYCGTRWMQSAIDQRSRRFRLIMSIVALFTPLIAFKYTNFFVGEIARLGGHVELRILDVGLPLGISFVTFTLTAFIVDTYHGRYKQSDGPSTVLAYVLFFPHLIAGPILRPQELMPQLEQPKPWQRAHFTAAVAIFTVGLVKKLVFADQVADVVEQVYANPLKVSWAEAVYAFYAYAIQIYCDFSGYTDMAIGTALLLGVRLPTNFLRPYLATSPVDFWRRWHVTLSRWLRDYLYIPLGGNRSGLVYEVRNVMITMVLGGLWHGANWTFVLWGAMHGLGVSTTHVLKKGLRWTWLDRLPRSLAILLTFHFVCIGWIFFRAPNIVTARDVLARLSSADWSTLKPFVTGNPFLVLLAVLFAVLHPYDDMRRIKWVSRYARREILWPIMVTLWVLAITLSQGSSAKFIYYDF